MAKPLPALLLNGDEGNGSGEASRERQGEGIRLGAIACIYDYERKQKKNRKWCNLVLDLDIDAVRRGDMSYVA